MIVRLTTVKMVKIIAGNRPTYSMMHKQVKNKPGGGNLYSLLVGREFKPDQYAIF